jgi:hypothetical protein
MYVFRELCGGPVFRKIKSGFARRSQAEAYARDWLERNGKSIILLEHDDECDGIDIMTTAADKKLYQYAIEGN